MVVEIMTPSSKERVSSLIDSAKFAMDIPSKLCHLRRLRGELFRADAALLSDSLPSLLLLHTDPFSPVRKLITQMIGDIGLKWIELLPEIVPVLLTILKDGTPAVAKQAVACGIDLFRSTFVKIAIQGKYSSELDDMLETSWAWLIKLKDEIYTIVFQPGSDGRSLVALKFVEAVILLYTPDPSGSLEPPDDHSIEEKSKLFNISWLRGGHQVLKIGDLSVEASRSLGLLLDQLRFPTVRSLSNLTAIVNIKSLSSIAKKRPAFYGRILPVLLGLDPFSSFSQGSHVSGVHHALKNAFSCLKCAHPSAVPWQDRLDAALKEINAGWSANRALKQVCWTSGNVEGQNPSSLIQEEKPSIEILDVQNNGLRKRAVVLDESSNLSEDDAVSGKRVKSTPKGPDASAQELRGDQTTGTSTGSAVYRGSGDNGPVLQLVAMFAALVSQGEKAIGSLEILVSSISADLLAEVVMANMQHLPPSHPNVDPNVEGIGEQKMTMGSHPKIVDNDTQFKQLSSFLTDLISLSNGFPTPSPVQRSASNEPEKHDEYESPVVTSGSDLPSPVLKCATEQAPVTTTTSVSKDVSSVVEVGSSIMPSEGLDVGYLENEIPGLDSSFRITGLPKTVILSSLASTDPEETSQEHISSLGRLPMDVCPAVSAERSEELSPKATVTDVTSVNSSTATSVGQSTQFILPKMLAPVILLEDEQKDKLQKFAFMRIIEVYRQVAVAGGSQVRFSLLAYLGDKSPLELAAWKLLRSHILSDYVSHEGHELTLQVLFRLFGEAEEDTNFFSSKTAASVYETFLLTVAETLRDSFPAADKSLSRLLNEVPYLPKSIYNLLESLCSPGNRDDEEKELPSGDRVTQGLSAVWSLILLRPPIREVCLNIALQSAVNHLEEVRMKAIRLVANKLYPLSSISKQIEEFAKEKLFSVAKVEHLGTSDTIAFDAELLNDPNLAKSSDERSLRTSTKDIPSDSQQSSTTERTSSSLSEVQRCMSLYFALCTKKHSLLREIFLVYSNTSDAVRQVVHHQIPLLVRTMRSSQEVLEIISDPPTGSEDLLILVLNALTDGILPSQELVSSVKKLYDTKLKHIQILIPVLPFLPRDEVLLVFRHFVNLPLDKFQAVLGCVLQGASYSDPILSPAEVLIAIHGIDPDKDGIPLKKVTDACNACFEQREIFTQQVIAKVLNHLVEQIPLPLLFMRTVLQAIGAFPSLMEFIMEILSRLVSKQIWKYPKLWVGFLKCALLTKPQSFGVLLQLPPAQLEGAFNRTPALKAPLIAHANQPNIRSSLPRSVLVVLGLVSDSPLSIQAKTSEAQEREASDVDKGSTIEK